MTKELKRLKNLDEYYNLHLADLAENLEEKYKNRQEENIKLLYEIDGIPRNKKRIIKIPALGSGGLYSQFGNNKIQKYINKYNFCIVKK